MKWSRFVVILVVIFMAASGLVFNQSVVRAADPTPTATSDYGVYEVFTIAPVNGIGVNNGEVAAVWWKVTVNGAYQGNCVGFWMWNPGTYNVQAEGRLRKWRLPAGVDLDNFSAWWQNMVQQETGTICTYTWYNLTASTSATPTASINYRDYESFTASPVNGVTVSADEQAAVWYKVTLNGEFKGNCVGIWLEPGNYPNLTAEGRVRKWRLPFGINLSDFRSWWEQEVQGEAGTSCTYPTWEEVNS